MKTISFEEFKKLDLRIGRILTAEPIENSEKLLKLTVDVGDEKRQIIAGIAGVYRPTELIGKNFVVLTNLEPKKLMGLESQGMILCAESDGVPVCLTPLKEVTPGSKVL
ncbi:MAG: methionine--tRNA ligase subunit beta [Candidatus Woykebacteria bacterium RBG_16_44_10]|uniref:Methionine--tRNA ligase n=1 Tax=Candidatus Woykebacteria bacterium RBG_16_44_10 TaxID=1802597 RepID=A0A1G1WFC3_9BACT|nr:MAG: methionine--tRNA ligase subunit beta [Candidatus Woykebacteria bacterium RBG_16_44_10]